MGARNASASAQQATDRKQEARGRAIELERQLDINRVNRAHGEWRENNIALTISLLDECPPNLRGWEWDYCRRLCHRERLTIRGHGKAIVSMALSPDGRWLLMAAGWSELGPAVGEWTIWETATGRGLETRPAQKIRSVAVDPYRDDVRHRIVRGFARGPAFQADLGSGRESGG